LSSYLGGLDRSFAEADFQMIDINVSMPTSEVDELLRIAQVSMQQVANGRAKNLPDFEYTNATLKIKLNG